MKKGLIVEDHPDMLDVLSRQLEMLGFAVITASNGADGVEKAIGEKPDIILMDIMMPGMDGREATRRIRANPTSKDIPILATTVLFRQSELNKCIEAGCNDYMVKPFTFKELREKLKEILPNHVISTPGVVPRGRPKCRATASPSCGVMDLDSTGGTPIGIVPAVNCGVT